MTITSHKPAFIMNKIITLVFSALILLTLFGCSKEEPIISSTPNEITEEENNNTSQIEDWDLGLAEANTIFSNLFRIAIAEGTKSYIAETTGLNISNFNCSPTTATIYNGSGQIIQLQMDFGTECQISPGVFVSGIFIIRTPSGSIDGSIESNPGFIRFESVTINGCKITGPRLLSEDTFRFFKSETEVRPDGNTYNSYDFVALTASAYSLEQLSTGQIATYTPVNVFDGSGNFGSENLIPLLRITTLSSLTLDYPSLLAATYELKLLPIQGTTEPNWQVISFDGTVYRIITDDNADLIMSPSCAAIIDGTLQLRAPFGNYDILKAYNYGISDLAGTTPNPALCDNWGSIMLLRKWCRRLLC